MKLYFFIQKSGFFLPLQNEVNSLLILPLELFSYFMQVFEELQFSGFWISVSLTLHAQTNALQ